MRPAEAELALRDLHGGREARVEVEVGDVVDADLRGGERVGDGGGEPGRTGQASRAR